jgi:hypothetical protein
MKRVSTRLYDTVIILVLVLVIILSVLATRQLFWCIDHTGQAYCIASVMVTLTPEGK